MRLVLDTSIRYALAILSFYSRRLFFVYLDRFKVDKRFDSNGCSLVVSSISLFPELCPPCSCLNREPSVSCHGSSRNSSKRWTKLICQDTAHHGDLQCRWNQMKDHRREQKADSSVVSRIHILTNGSGMLGEPLMDAVGGNGNMATT